MQVLIYLFPDWGFLILVWMLSYQCQEEKERYILMFLYFSQISGNFSLFISGYNKYNECFSIEFKM